MSNESLKSKSILRLPEVIKRTGIPRSSIYSAIKDGQFPSPISLGARRIGFLENEIDTWLEGRIKQSRSSEKSKSGEKS